MVLISVIKKVFNFKIWISLNSGWVVCVHLKHGLLSVFSFFFNLESRSFGGFFVEHFMHFSNLFHNYYLFPYFVIILKCLPLFASLLFNLLLWA